MLIYRGVSAVMDAELNGDLQPKGRKETYEFTADTTCVTMDNNEVTINASKVNAAYAHQHELIQTDETAWISCSLSFEVAKHFATSGGMISGYIYELETGLFAEHSVEMINVLASAPEKEEREVTIRPLNGLRIPQKVIVKKHKIEL